MTGSLRALLEAGVANAPDKVVISADGAELSWSRLHDQACRVAAALVRDGVKPQDRVIYLGKLNARVPAGHEVEIHSRAVCRPALDTW